MRTGLWLRTTVRVPSLRVDSQKWRYGRSSIGRFSPTARKWRTVGWTEEYLRYFLLSRVAHLFSSNPSTSQKVDQFKNLWNTSWAVQKWSFLFHLVSSSHSLFQSSRHWRKLVVAGSMCSPPLRKGAPLHLEECGKLSHLEHARQWFNKLLPVPPLVLVACLPFIPTGAYLNRGFTIWFHWACVAGWLTHNAHVNKFIVVVGTSICIGWYASILSDFLYFDRPVLRLLYKNMLPSMTKIIVDESTGKLNFHSESIAMMVLSHVLDFCGHPGLVYYFWRAHVRRGGRLVDLVSWPAVASAYIYSRTWSIVHNYYNYGQVGYFYFGLNIYNLDCVKQWFPAYLAESMFFVAVILFKLWTRRCDFSKTSKSKEAVDNTYRFQPTLVYSESSMESFRE